MRARHSHSMSCSTHVLTGAASCALQSLLPTLFETTEHEVIGSGVRVRERDGAIIWIIGERERTRELLLRRACPPLILSGRSDNTRSKRGGYSHVLVVFVKQIISQLWENPSMVARYLPYVSLPKYGAILALRLFWLFDSSLEISWWLKLHRISVNVQIGVVTEI